MNKPSKNDEVRAAQRDSWNEFAPGWEKWDAFMTDWLGPVGDAMLEEAGLQGGQRMLDVCCGTGEPALTAARSVPEADVLATDLSEAMVGVVRAKADKMGLRDHFKAEARSADALGLADASFDVVTSRFGLMYVPDLDATLREMIRVLKPRGRLVTAVWGDPARNKWLSAVAKILRGVLDLPPPEPDAPGVFRLAASGMLEGALRESGLAEVRQTEIDGTLSFESPQEHWQWVLDIAAPVVKALDAADDAARDRIERTVVEETSRLVRDGRLTFEWSAWIVSGRR